MKKMGIIFVIVISLSMAVFFTIYDSRKIDKLHKEYKEVNTNDELNGIITKLYTDKGITFLILDDSIKIYLDISRNYNYSGKYIHLSHMLSIGDTIIKNKGTDTLIVRKQSKEYYFIVGEFINKK